jgi:hypothetical protein
MSVSEKSGFVFCGCNKSTANIKQQKTAINQRQTPATLQPAGSKTDEDAHKEAKKYVNDEIPAYNKLFIGTILLISYFIITETKNSKENE